MDKASIKCNKCMEKDRVSRDSYLTFLNFRSVDLPLFFHVFIIFRQGCHKCQNLDTIVVSTNISKLVNVVW